MPRRRGPPRISGVAAGEWRAPLIRENDHQDRRESERGFGQAVALELAHGAGGRKPGSEMKAVGGRKGDHCRKQAELHEDQPAVGRLDEIADAADFVPAIDDAGREQQADAGNSKERKSSHRFGRQRSPAPLFPAARAIEQC
jgi:hypothetical protein